MNSYRFSDVIFVKIRLIFVLYNVDTENLTKNQDLDIALLMKNLYSLDNSTHLSKKQIEMIKKLLLANKDFILSA